MLGAESLRRDNGAVKKNLGKNPDLILLVNSDYPLLFPGTYI